jgi:hypothetical protein
LEVIKSNQGTLMHPSQDCQQATPVAALKRSIHQHTRMVMRLVAHAPIARPLHLHRVLALKKIGKILNKD